MSFLMDPRDTVYHRRTSPYEKGRWDPRDLWSLCWTRGRGPKEPKKWNHEGRRTILPRSAPSLVDVISGVSRTVHRPRALWLPTVSRNTRTGELRGWEPEMRQERKVEKTEWKGGWECNRRENESKRWKGIPYKELCYSQESSNRIESPEIIYISFIMFGKSLMFTSLSIKSEASSQFFRGFIFCVTLTQNFLHIIAHFVVLLPSRKVLICCIYFHTFTLYSTM